ncbi:hypothetical protein K488DRAFT_78028 [Vararia minispora EC-137]|uniref:Uncharacterized protein n=1 Tax=Vararia minispora EC-137 TaxID=1314806 RepID=A0ACB8QP01_9AGAM|nr:hypothetical protein K488DRAFT_78028 [Vararia minispora EC-137]
MRVIHLGTFCVFLVLWPAAFAKTNFTQCLQMLNDGTFGDHPDGARNNKGMQVPAVDATAVSYDFCKTSCGAGPEPFSWTTFSTQFSSWLLPWLALLSQLPFGSTFPTDDVVSVFLTVGSPALAAYSLILTILNGKWVSRRLSGIRYPNVHYIWRVLNSLQQSSLNIDDSEGMLASLVILPENDEWWEEMAHGLDYTQTWSPSTISQIAWVFIAYLFTVIVSFLDTPDSVTANSNGQGVGSGFLWLLPIVIGWLQLSPKCDSARVGEAFFRADGKAFRATDDPTRPALASESTGHRALSLSSYKDSEARHDEEASAPIYNYARVLPWIANVERVFSVLHTAAERAACNEPVSPDARWKPADRHKCVADDNRRGTLEQVLLYACRPRAPQTGRIDPDFVSRFMIATAMAFFLQWATVGGAIIAVWFTPAIGLGCRSGSYLLYAAVGTIVWAIMVTSSFFAYYSTMESSDTLCARHSRMASRRAAGIIAVLLRRFGKFLATLNSIWIVLCCILQFSSSFDTCWCNASVLGLGKDAFYVISFLPSDIRAMTRAWILGIVLALGSAVVFGIFVYLHINPPSPAPPKRV